MSKYVICTAEQWGSVITQANYDGYYTSLADWQTARDGVDAANEDSDAYIYGQLALSTEFIITGWTNDKDSSHWINIRPAIESARHDGKLNTTGHGIIFSGTTTNVIDVREPRVHVRDLFINAASTTSAPLEYRVANFWVSGCVLWIGDQHSGVLTAATGATNLYFNNNFVLAHNLGTYYIFSLSLATINAYIYANTFYAGTGRGIAFSGGTYDLANNIVVPSDRPYTLTGATVTAHNEAYPTTTTYDPPSHTGSNHVEGVTAANLFVQPTFDTSLNVDCHLNPLGSDYSAVHGHGWGSLDDNGNLNVVDDIDGNARNATTPDIGADEISTAASITSTSAIQFGQLLIDSTGTHGLKSSAASQLGQIAIAGVAEREVKGPGVIQFGQLNIDARTANNVTSAMNLGQLEIDAVAERQVVANSAINLGQLELDVALLAAPTDLFCNNGDTGAQSGDVNPTGISDTTPNFSMHVTKLAANITHVNIQVSTEDDADFSEELSWDSGWLELVTPIASVDTDGMKRTEDITYGQS